MNGCTRRLYRVTLAVSLVLFLMLMAGCMEPEPDAGQEMLLTQGEVEAVLKEEGLELTRVWVRLPVIEDIPIRPTAYAIGEPDKYLFVYEFDTVAARREFFPFSPSGMAEYDGNTLHLPVTAKNVAMIYAQPLDVSADMGLFNPIARAVFYGMHEVKEETFLGQGDYWDARLHFEYFEYPWENNDGEQELEFHQLSTLTLQYLGDNPEEIYKLGYTVTLEVTEMGTSSGGSRVYMEQGVLDENGAFRWSNITRKRIEKDSLELRIEWDDGEEKFNAVRTAPAGSTAG